MPRGGGGAGGGHGPRAQALEGAPAQLVGHNCKRKCRVQWRMQDLPNGGGGHPEPRRRQPCRPMRRGGGGGANSGGGGAPMQALAPGRWRPSVRHYADLPNHFVTIPQLTYDRERHNDTRK